MLSTTTALRRATALPALRRATALRRALSTAPRVTPNLTKIVATIGPASEDAATLRSCCAALACLAGGGRGANASAMKPQMYP